MSGAFPTLHEWLALTIQAVAMLATAGALAGLFESILLDIFKHISDEEESAY